MKKFITFLLILFAFFTLKNKVSAQGATCAEATQLCDDPACGVFDIGSGQGNDPIAGESSSCVGSDPNATWFFLIDDQGGGGTINITNNPALDTDFVAWGPFDSPADALAACNGGISPANEVGCDFSAAPGGTINMPATSQVGDVYLMVVTNFSNQPGIQVNVSAPPLQCCPVATGMKAPVEICSGGTATSAITDFEGSATEITGATQFLSDLGTSTSETAFVAPVAADFTNNTCAPIVLTLYHLFDCDSNCDGASDGPAVAGSFDVTIYPDATTFVATETPGACGTAAMVSIATADGTVCFTDAGAVPADLGCNMNDDQTLNYTFDPGFALAACNMMFSGSVAALCVGTGCACTDPCFVEYDPAAAPPGDATLCVTPVPPMPCDDGDPCTENDMQEVGGDGVTICAPCVGMVVAPPDPTFSVAPNPIPFCSGPVAITATTPGGTFSGSGAPLVVSTTVDPLLGNPGVPYSLTYTVSTPGGCMDSSTIMFTIVNDCNANGGEFGN